MVTKARADALDDWYTMLDTKEGVKQVYEIARNQIKQKRGIDGIPALKDLDGRLVVTEGEKVEGWKKYFQNFMNEENVKK